MTKPVLASSNGVEDASAYATLCKGRTNYENPASCGGRVGSRTMNALP
jgi:hypothetical protein